MTRKRRSTSSLSSTADGSSMTISRASWDSARAMLTICCAAADSVPTSAVGRISGWPSRASSSRGRRGWPRPVRVKPEPGELVAEEDVLGDGEAGDQVELLVDRRDAQASWRPAGRSATTGSPRQVIAPASGWCAPASTLIRVDLPAPFWPSRQCTSPARTSRSTPSERADAGERLDDAVHLQQRRRPRRCRTSVTPSPGLLLNVDH